MYVNHKKQHICAGLICFVLKKTKIEIVIIINLMGEHFLNI